MRVLPTFRKPLIAAINGLAIGGGLETALMADIIVCSANAKFSMPEVNYGLNPGLGGCKRLLQAMGKTKTLDMMLTADTIDAQDALKWGLVSRVYPDDESSLLSGAIELAGKIASKPLMAACYIKRSIRHSLEVGETAAIAFERSLMIASTNSYDSQEGVSAFLSKRKPNYLNK